MPQAQSQNELQTKYEDSGYIVVDDVIPESTITNVERGVDEILSQFANSDETRDDVCLRLDEEDQEKLYHINQTLRMLPELHAIEQELQKITRKLFPENKTTLTFTTNILIGLPENERLAYDWHQESSYLPTTNGFVNFWYPLFEDATAENGAMGLLEGSHREGHIEWDEESEGKSRTDHIPENVDELEEQYEQVRSEINRKSVVAFHPDMIHRSGSNCTNRVRFTGVTRMGPIDEICSKVSDFADLY